MSGLVSRTVSARTPRSCSSRPPAKSSRTTPCRSWEDPDTAENTLSNAYGVTPSSLRLGWNHRSTPKEPLQGPRATTGAVTTGPRVPLTATRAGPQRTSFGNVWLRGRTRPTTSPHLEPRPSARVRANIPSPTSLSSPPLWSPTSSYRPRLGGQRALRGRRPHHGIEVEGARIHGRHRSLAIDHGSTVGRRRRPQQPRGHLPSLGVDPSRTPPTLERDRRSSPRSVAYRNEQLADAVQRISAAVLVDATLLFPRPQRSASQALSRSLPSPAM